MFNTPETSKRGVEHKVYMIKGILLLVFELKLAFRNIINHVAQVLLELVYEPDVFLHKSIKLIISSGI